ncbi:MAG TPA: flagellar hook-associated protein FlgL [Solirubrobacteraceae bacterium]|nr:flagellar hook-associated protein FlgL [Solirubrobacteraceae bacterium]
MSTSRITSSMIHRGVLADLNDIATRVSRTQLKLSSGKEILRPSDDPFGAGRALGLRSELDGLGQYRRNAADADGWTTATETALGTITDIAQRARELLLRGANGTTSPVERETIAKEIDQLIGSTKDTMNSTYAGRSLFGGTETATKPYGSASDAYLGDGGDIVRSVGPGVTLIVNTRGTDVVGDGTDGKLLNTLRDIAAHLRGTTPADSAALGSSDIVAIDRSLDAVLDARAQVGAIARRVASADWRLAELEENVRGLLSQTEDADMAATLVDYSMQQSVYQSALRAGANIVQTSLLDFLR